MLLERGFLIPECLPTSRVTWAFGPVPARKTLPVLLRSQTDGNYAHASGL